MKKFKFALGVLFSLLVTAVPSLTYAREVNYTTGSSTPDAWSVAGGNCYSGGLVTGCEVAVDFNGNFLPTVGNVQTLGTASLPWLNVYALNGNTAGNEMSGTAGTSTLATAGTAATVHTILGGLAFTSVTLGSNNALAGVNISTIVPVNSSYEILTSSGGPIVLTSKPNISTTTLVGGSTLIPDGFILIVTSTLTAAAGGITLQSNGSLTGTQLFLGAATRVIALHDVLTLKFHAVAAGAASYWEELAYGSDNN